MSSYLQLWGVCLSAVFVYKMDGFLCVYVCVMMMTSLNVLAVVYNYTNSIVITLLTIFNYTLLTMCVQTVGTADNGCGGGAGARSGPGQDGEIDR